MMVTPSNIIELKANEIFVFGSNLDGLHKGGAARFAHEKLGAEWGIGVGPTGLCYAIPTVFLAKPAIPILTAIKHHVNDFIDYAIKHQDKTFLVTEIGCGIAGFKHEQIAPMFRPAMYSTNIALPQRFIEIIEMS